MIRYLKNHEIDMLKWDNCIARSFNGNIFGYSWFLDVVSHGWEALVEDNYVRVMPLTTVRKNFITSLQQPDFARQLGIYSVLKLDTKVTKLFFDSIPRNIKYFKIKTNLFNLFEEDDKKTEIEITYQLDLINPYTQIYDRFNATAKNEIEKSFNNQLTYSVGLMPNSIFSEGFLGNFDSNKWLMLRQITSNSLRRGLCEIYGVYSKKNSLCVVAVFISSHNKSNILFVAANKEGKSNGAIYGLLNYYIKVHSSRHLTLNIVESEIIKSALCRNINCTESKFYTIQKHLPGFLRWLE